MIVVIMMIVIVILHVVAVHTTVVIDIVDSIVLRVARLNNVARFGLVPDGLVEHRLHVAQQLRIDRIQCRRQGPRQDGPVGTVLQSQRQQSIVNGRVGHHAGGNGHEIVFHDGRFALNLDQVINGLQGKLVQKAFVVILTLTVGQQLEQETGKGQRRGGIDAPRHAHQELHFHGFDFGNGISAMRNLGNQGRIHGFGFVNLDRLVQARHGGELVLTTVGQTRLCRSVVIVHEPIQRVHGNGHGFSIKVAKVNDLVTPLRHFGATVHVHHDGSCGSMLRAVDSHFLLLLMEQVVLSHVVSLLTAHGGEIVENHGGRRLHFDNVAVEGLSKTRIVAMAIEFL
mmetsp:Transcript_20993/g.58111  ORF Transcript_20993/g.58111 Transcript_20993/m.58111 type:complete len:340 (-) Transcript_20993:33-1052(-)